VCAILPLAHACGAAEGGTATACELTARAAVTVLPAGIQPWFVHRLESLTSDGSTEDRSAAGAQRPALPDSAHYLKLDVAASDSQPGASPGAAARFPTDQAEAKELFKRCGERQGGTLPWTVRRHFDALIAAYESGEQESILREAGILLRLSTAAALPFNTTSNRDGAATGNLILTKGTAQRALLPHRTVRHRCHVGLLLSLKSRLAYELRLSPDRYHAITDPVEEVFAVMRRAHDALPLLLAADRDALTALGVSDADSFTAGKYRYYTLLSDRAGWIMEARLKDAATLGANLIGTAWTLAGGPVTGQPPLPPVIKGTKVESSSPHEAVDDGRFVASKQSKVFHKASCPHARRISPGNRICFATLEEMLATGRKPCKTCRPDRP
jgi:hypothetical protein